MSTTSPMDGTIAAAPAPTAPPAPRPSRARPTSYYNHFQTTCAVSRDDPPTYLAATRHVRPSQPSAPAIERLPSYQCTLQAECKMLMCVESVSPLNPAVDAEWRDVFVAVRGTMLSIYRIRDDQPGKLIRTYTLQHAEVGLATDTRHSVLVPRSRLASLLPTAARRRAWAKDPSLFEVVRQTALRVRVETDQLLLADASEERVHAIISAISAGLDIALPIDERSIPRQCTMPRRQNRRPRPQRSAEFAAADLADPDLLAEQTRILRTMYPSLADSSSVHSAASQTASDALLAPAETRDEPSPATPTREEDEPDLSIISEDSSASAADDTATSSDSAPEYTPSASSHDSTSSPPPSSSESENSTHFSGDMMYATAATNFDEVGKWAPTHPRSASQTLRYVRRCMPVLLVDAPRASDIVCTAAGKRVKINYRMELLEDWALAPPSYKSHMFAPRDNPVFAAANIPTAGVPTPAPLTRTVSHISSTASAVATDDEDLHGDASDLITPAAQPANAAPVDTTVVATTTHSGLFSLGKFRSKRSTSSASTTTVAAKELRDTTLLSRHELSGLAYCF